MAIYHLSVSNVSRAGGSKATATLSYITGKRVHDERRDETYDYGRKERVIESHTLLPEGAPAEWRDPERLFNGIETHEKGRTVRPAKKIVVALPREFTPAQRVQALEGFIRENLTSDGYAATYAIHEDREGSNPHAHILVANRQIDPKTGGWARLKQRMEYVLDDQGNRVPQIDPETGRQKTDKRGRRQWRRRSVSLNPLDRKAKLQSLRESWADTCNALLPETARIDHRSLEDQGSDLEPTIHEGYAARAIERAGGVSERCQTNREIRRSNGLLTAIRHELSLIFDRLGELFAAKISQLRQRRTQPEPAREPNWRYYAGEARRQLEADRKARVAELTGQLEAARKTLDEHRSKPEEQTMRAAGIIDVARDASREADNANIFRRVGLHRKAEQVAAEQSARLRDAFPWLEDTEIPATYVFANAFRNQTTAAIHAHETKPLADHVAELEARLDKAANAPIGTAQITDLAMSMARRRAEAEKPKPTRATDGNGPSTPEEAPRETEPRETPQKPAEARRKTKADLLAAIERRAEEKTGEERQRRQEREQTLDDLWEMGQWNNPSHGFSR